MSSLATEMRVPALERVDRCDACQVAQATVRVQLKSGRILDFCGHHYTRHGSALAPSVSSLVRWDGDDHATGTMAE